MSIYTLLPDMKDLIEEHLNSFNSEQAKYTALLVLNSFVNRNDAINHLTKHMVQLFGEYYNDPEYSDSEDYD